MPNELFLSLKLIRICLLFLLSLMEIVFVFKAENTEDTLWLKSTNLTTSPYYSLLTTVIQNIEALKLSMKN
jgi:hypothetical protein